MKADASEDQQVPILTEKEVIEKEREWLLGRPLDGDQSRSKDSSKEMGGPVKPPEDNLELAALCLSGGGIRSAAFCLGVIQAFAARKMLRQFHYLSTVSGGGYIGGWLTRCIKAWNGDVAAAEEHLNIYNVQQKSAGHPSNTLLRDYKDEPPEINRLRRFANFLTPDPGIGSADTWAGIILWLRNTLINWAVFFPLTVAAVAVPVLYYALVCMLGGSKQDVHSIYPANPMFLMALFCLAVANFFVCRSLPTHVANQIDRKAEVQAGISAAGVWWRIGVWSLLWSFLVPLALAPALVPPQSANPVHQAFWAPKSATDPASVSCPHFQPAPSSAKPVNPAPCQNSQPVKSTRLWELITKPSLYQLPALNVLVSSSAYLLAAIASFSQKFHRKDIRTIFVVCLSRCRARQGRKVSDKKAESVLDLKIPESVLDLSVFVWNFLPWVFSSCLSSLILFAGIILAYGGDAMWIALAGPVWVIGAELLRSTFYVAIRQNGFLSDLDREWLARLSAIKLRTVLGIGIFGTAAVFLPKLLIDNRPRDFTYLATAATFATGPVAALIGKSALTPFSHGSKSKTPIWQRPELLVGAGSIVFAFTMFMLCGRLVETVTEDVLAAIGLFRPQLLQSFRDGSQGAFVPTCCALTLLGLMFCALAYFVDNQVNLNRFSMHAVYRNRLIRAFLGVARSATYDDRDTQPTPHVKGVRVPDRFTGFDPTDNIRLSDASKRTASKDGLALRTLFPVINVALNTTTGKGTARARRKSEAFTITPLHCGAGALGQWNGAYVRTEMYAGEEKLTGPYDKERGITLGTAMAISGAAVSPNMGYHSSPFAAFLMTLFNVRLGAWLPNPGKAGLSGWSPKAQSKFLRRGGPKNAIGTMFDELTGQSDETSKYIYLSDGGHFDNLGLYEMLRRRCKFIVVVDVGADPDYAYFDLGHVLQTATIDFGVQVQFRPALKTKDKTLNPYGAFADVTYRPTGPDAIPETGQIIYIKPWLPPAAPIELLAYKRVKKEFPFESTADQFFTENDFESYRRLGEYLTNDLMDNISAGDTVGQLFKNCEEKSKKP